MGLAHSPQIVTNGLVFYYDMNNTEKSWKGQPTTNMLVSQGLAYSFYAYVSGAPTTITTLGHKSQTLIANRYTISSAINTARAAFFPSSLTTNTNYVFSVYIRYNGTQTPTFGFDASKGNPEGGANNNSFNTNTLTTTALNNGWYKLDYLFNFSSCPTGKCILTFGIITGSDSTYVNQTFDVYNAQLETNSFATPYVNGTRSNTQALFDLTGQNTITASSLTYASDGTFSFNGSSNLMIFPENSSFNTQTPTVEVWIKTNATSQNGFWFEKGNVNTQYSLFQEGTVIQWRQYFSSGQGLTNLSTTTSSYINTSNWAHVVGTFTSGDRRLYINGQLVNSDSQAGTINTNTNGSSIGVYGGFNGGRGYYYNGRIGSVKVYNRVLTASEISQNFAAQRGLYGV